MLSGSVKVSCDALTLRDWRGADADVWRHAVTWSAPFCIWKFTIFDDKLMMQRLFPCCNLILETLVKYAQFIQIKNIVMIIFKLKLIMF